MSSDSRIQIMRVPTVEDWVLVRRNAAQQLQHVRRYGTGSNRDMEAARLKRAIANATAQIARLDPKHPSLIK